MNLAEWSLKLKRGPHAHAGGRALPPLLFLTDRHRLPHPERVIACLPRGSGVILRDYKVKKRAALAAKLAYLCRRRHLCFLVGGDAALARKVRADGLHLRERQLKRPARRHNPAWIITAAAHSPRAIRRARASGADAALVSPVFATGSHPKKKPLGARRLAQWTRQSPLPLYALGGVTLRNARALNDIGIIGVAAISGFAQE